ncbi:MAG: hypothetical protein K0R12_1412 [Gammaproteobacteria bacterium]|jgi:hypothetical protein|nr:hypothetical protein [Gammaproteobacteria bacterium]
MPAWLYRLSSAPLNRTAHISNRYSGYATITHPFHSLQGKRLKILSTKKQSKHDVFSLHAEGIGTVAVLRDWTDRADPSPYLDWLKRAPILSVEHLFTLSELLNDLDKFSGS